MFWDSNSKCLSAMLAAFAAAASPGYAMAGIVVASSGPSSASFPPGKKLADDAQITLKTADSVTILDAKGTRVLRGAGTFTVGAPGAVTRTATFVALTRERGAQRVRTGAVRGPNGKPVSPNLWYVNLTKSGTFCVVDPTTIRVWRPEKDSSATYLVSDKAGTKTARLVYSDGVTVAPWDVATAPVTEGATYAINSTNGANRATVSFTVLPARDYAPEDLAAVLIAKGCTEQVDLLATSLALPQDAPAAM